MDLTHTFSVPTSLDDTWAHFQDIGALAECFPGAQVTAVGEDAEGAPTFEGTCKVKLGPIALVYAGAGSFVERDEAAHRFVVDAKGRDKRGNGTAGAKVTVSMGSAGDATLVEVVTDLAITGKPAQFGRGVMQDVSDKLLGQFVTCLEQRLAADTAPVADAPADPVETTPTEPGESAAAPAAAPRPAPVASPAAQADDALDLGSAVLPVLLKSYGKKAAIALVALLGVVKVVRRLRR
ncbi:carbon monoxide dehydrogenase [Nocardioides sp. Root190]|uniref:SRPBCC family protein n=1 Tax=Nocardioides sp. Root190 TaxID=1736488 RepID=UPI0006FAB41F|nr:SRPBCC family protein [Nocardioides sp. Root190]KRB76844.1 carbon monoxide dehydrogenase [Nocardioides sp. Root190]